MNAAGEDETEGPNPRAEGISRLTGRQAEFPTAQLLALRLPAIEQPQAQLLTVGHVGRR